MKNAYQICLVFILLVNVCEGQKVEKEITWYHTLKEVSITHNARPDTVSGSKQWMIFDFAFCEKGILLLTYTKNENKCALQLLKDNSELELISNESSSSHWIPNRTNTVYSIVSFFGLYSRFTVMSLWKPHTRF